MFCWVINVHIVLVAVFGSAKCISFVKESDWDASLQIPTDKGTIQGRKTTTYNGKEYWAYQGIPYARPPMGSLRFRAPKLAESWNGVLDATREGSSCVETFFRPRGLSANGTEDCLFLNVFSPQDPKAALELLPVLVWFYGGAFIEGNSSTKMFGPDFLLQQGVIVVTFNYRVGIFGFLSTGDLSSPGNYGLKDQNFALQWVQRNIRNFGGDKNRVTISGQSAGGSSVLYHLASPKSRGLFHRAISNSGSSLCTFGYQRHAREIAFQVGGAVGVNTKNSKELVATLRKVSIERLNDIVINLVVLQLAILNQEGFPFSPVIEPNHKGAFISESTYTLFEKGHFNRVPVLMGINSLESIFFAELVETTKSLGILFEVSPGSFTNPSFNLKSYEKKREVGIKIKNHYFRSRSYFEGTKQERLNYVSDDQFVRPIRKTAELISRYIPVYFYVFSYQSAYGIRGFDDYLKDDTKGESYSWRLNPTASVYTAEFYAIKQTLRYSKFTRQNTIIICSDLLSTLHAIANNFSYDPQVQQTLALIHWLRELNKYVHIVWTPGHIGIKGNELADDVVRQTAENENIDSVSHAEELPFFWKYMRRSSPKGLDALIVARVTKLYTNFAKTGNPTPEEDALLQNLIWPTVNCPSMTYLDINKNLTIGRNFREEHIRFWNKLYEDYGVKPFVSY